jgi:hypothetical protein
LITVCVTCGVGLLVILIFGICAGLAVKDIKDFENTQVLQGGRMMTYPPREPDVYPMNGKEFLNSDALVTLKSMNATQASVRL